MTDLYKLDSGIFLTVDSVRFGFREADARNGFNALPRPHRLVNYDEEVATTSNATAESNAAKAQLLYDAVVPLINNLKANPEKDYIYWPNRYEKLDAFADKLHQISIDFHFL